MSPELTVKLWRPQLDELRAELAAERTKRQGLEAAIEQWRIDFAKRLQVPINNSGDNLVWAVIARGRIDALEAELAAERTRRQEAEREVAVWQQATSDNGELYSRAEAENAALRERCRVLTEALQPFAVALAENKRRFFQRWAVTTLLKAEDVEHTAALALAASPPADALAETAKRASQRVAEWPQWKRDIRIARNAEPPASADATEGE